MAFARHAGEIGLSGHVGLLRLDLSAEIMRRQDVGAEMIRATDYQIAPGVWADMTEHGWDRDDWPSIFDKVMAR